MADREGSKAKALFYASILLTACSLVLLIIAANTKAEIPFFLGLALFLVAGALIAAGFSIRKRDTEKRLDKLESDTQQED